MKLPAKQCMRTSTTKACQYQRNEHSDTYEDQHKATRQVLHENAYQKNIRLSKIVVGVPMKTDIGMPTKAGMRPA